MMRLLSCASDGRLVLTEYDEKNVPAYAILSHTWAENNKDEVTFH